MDLIIKKYWLWVKSKKYNKKRKGEINYGKSNVQIILRWHIQSDNIVIPGATNPEHIKANIDIFDFELTDEEMQEIAKINKNKRYYQGTPELLASYAAMRPDLDGQK